MSIRKLSVLLVVVGSVLALQGCSGGAGEGDFKGDTAKFKNADKQAAPGAGNPAKKGGSSLMAQP